MLTALKEQVLLSSLNFHSLDVNKLAPSIYVTVYHMLHFFVIRIIPAFINKPQSRLKCQPVYYTLSSKVQFQFAFLSFFSPSKRVK